MAEKIYPGHPDLTGGGATGLHSHPGGGLTFTELVGGEVHVVVGASTWEDWDLSAIIGAGAKSALVEIRQFYPGSRVGVRKNGSALVRYRVGTVGTGVILTEVDANRIIELYVADLGNRGNFSILGYWS